MPLRRLAIAMLALTSASAAAQAAPETTLIRIPNTTYVGINPLGIPFDLFTAEVESGVAEGVTLGGSGSYIDVNHDRWQSADFKFRYYPGDIVLRGFSVGGTVGFLNYSTTNCSSTTSVPNARCSVTTPTVGIITDYNWLLGADHRFVVGAGLGAKRTLASAEDRADTGLDRAYLTARFIVGLAF